MEKDITKMEKSPIIVDKKTLSTDEKTLKVKKVKPTLDKDTLIKVDNVYKSFGKNDKYKVLKGISFDIKRGEQIALIGANGAGKTTLVEIIASLSKASEGDIYYNFGEKGIAESIGMQFQDSEYPKGVIVKKLLNLFIEIYPSVTQEIADKYIKIFRLEEIMDKEVSVLSGGQKQRVNLFLSILHHPEFLILDEVSTGLDITTRKEKIEFIKILIKELKITVLIISHNSDEIQELAQKVIVLKDGKIVLTKTKEEINKKYKTMNDFLLKEA